LLFLHLSATVLFDELSYKEVAATAAPVAGF
jgi:hypothetical protein